LEVRINALKEEYQKSVDDLNEYRNSLKKRTDRILIKKYFPSWAKGAEDRISRVSYYPSRGTTIEFFIGKEEDSTTSTIMVYDCNTEIASRFFSKEEEKVKSLNEASNKKRTELTMVQKNYEELQKSPRRVKAQLIRNFLGNTSEGRKILSAITTSPKMKLLDK